MQAFGFLLVVLIIIWLGKKAYSKQTKKEKK